MDTNNLIVNFLDRVPFSEQTKNDYKTLLKIVKDVQKASTRLTIKLQKYVLDKLHNYCFWLAAKERIRRWHILPMNDVIMINLIINAKEDELMSHSA